MEKFLNNLFAFLIFIASFNNCIGIDLDYDGKLNIKLDHCLENTQNPLFSHRADIYIKSLQAGTALIDEFNLTNEQAEQLKSLVKQKGNYRLRATVKTADGKENYFYSFVKACPLVESHLHNVISVSLDHNGNVIAVTMTVPKICTGLEVNSNLLTTFSTSVVLRHMDLGPIPDTASFIQKMEREREAKERGETKDNRSFLAKYWMYIVPLVIFMLLPSVTNQESGGGTAPQR